MYSPRICVLPGLLCLLLLACGADESSSNPTAVSGAITSASASATTGTSSDTTGSSTSANAETSGTASSTTGDEPSTGVVASTGDTTGAVGTSGDGTTGVGTTGGDTSTGEPVSLSWAADVFPVILPASCACHTVGLGGLTMTDATASYEHLVDVVAFQAPMKLVKPGDPDNSYLLHKLRGTQAAAGGSGVQMPMKGELLSQDKVDLVAQWISEGAQP